MAKRKIDQSDNWSTSGYRFGFFLLGGRPGYEFVTGLYRHDQYGLVHVYSQESMAWVSCVVGGREFRTRCEPGSINTKTVQGFVAQLLIPQLNRDIEAWKQKTKGKS